MPTINIFDFDTALFDNNQKVALNGAVAELQTWSDEFGAVLEAHWSINSSGWGHTENGTVTESGNKLAIAATGVNLNYRGKGVYSPYVFNDLAVEVDYNNWVKGPGDPQWNLANLLVQKDINNLVLMRRYYDGPNDYISAHKVVATVWTTIGTFNTVVTNFKLKIVRSGNNFDTYYDVGAGWVQLGITTAAIIGANCSVYVSALARHTGTTSFDAMYCRITGSGYYWDDSPEIFVIDNALVEWAFDAGLGNVWDLSGASCTKTEPGASTVKFKVGYSDNGLLSGATWPDAIFQTIAQVAANAAAGLYDGHRYLHVIAQFASGGADKPDLTDFSIAGKGVNPRGQAHHDRMRRIKYGTSRIR